MPAMAPILHGLRWRTRRRLWPERSSLKVKVCNPGRLLGALRAKVPAKVFWVIAVSGRGFAGYAPSANQVCKRLLHRHHAIGASGLDAGPKLVVVAAANQTSSRRCGHQNLNGRIAVGFVHSWNELL